MPNEEEAPSQPHHLSKRTTKHHGIGIGTSCTVKGSYCSCHYCRCDMGLIHCVKHGATTFNSGLGIGKDNCFNCYNHYLLSILLKARTIATATWRGSTATATTASANTATEHTEENMGAAGEAGVAASFKRQDWKLIV